MLVDVVCGYPVSLLLKDSVRCLIQKVRAVRIMQIMNGCVQKLRNQANEFLSWKVLDSLPAQRVFWCFLRPPFWKRPDDSLCLAFTNTNSH